MFAMTRTKSWVRIPSVWPKISVRTERDESPPEPQASPSPKARNDAEHKDPVAFHEQRLKRIAQAQSELHKRYVQAIVCCRSCRACARPAASWFVLKPSVSSTRTEAFENILLFATTPLLSLYCSFPSPCLFFPFTH